MEFLYPKSQQFPFDSSCKNVVTMLAERNWQVPGIEIEFSIYGPPKQQFKKVKTIKGNGFEIQFGRQQGTLCDGQWYDSAATSEIIIPGKALKVNEDESGPTFFLYVGTNWEQDYEVFNGPKVHAKMDKKPRIYLRYKGGCICSLGNNAEAYNAEAYDIVQSMIDGKAKHTHPGRRSPLLIADNDLGRDYDPVDNEPLLFQTTEVMLEFKQYIDEVVLKLIRNTPC